MLGITPATLRSWLESKPQDDVVGRVLNDTSCPIATMIRETTGIRDVSVTASDIFAGPVHTKDIPDWLISFMLQVDLSPSPSRIVRAHEALTMLDSIPIE